MNTLTITGNLGADPDLRFTSSGKAVANIRIADTPRVKQGDQWVDGPTMWLNAVIWGEAGEAVAEHYRKGDRVVATGRLGARTWTDKDGTERNTVELTVEHIGRVERVERVKPVNNPF